MGRRRVGFETKTKARQPRPPRLWSRFVMRLEGELRRHLQLTGTVEIAGGRALLVEGGGTCPRIRAEAALQRGSGRSRSGGRAEFHFLAAGLLQPVCGDR